MDVSVKCTPNGEIRIVLQELPPVRKNEGDSRLVTELEQYARVHDTSMLEVVDDTRFSVVLSHSTSEQFICTSGESASYKKMACSALDIISDIQEKAKTNGKRTRFETKPGYGAPVRATRFGSYARRRILSGGSLLRARSKSPAESVLVTCTLPGDSPDAFRTISEWSGFLVNTTLQALRDEAKRLRRAGKCSEFSWFYVWELQKRGALHLHLCVWSRVPEETINLGHSAASGWERGLKSIGCKMDTFLARRNGTSCYLPALWQTDVSVVRKDVAAYVSKYVSKTSCNQSPQASDGQFHGYYPARWWGMDRCLSREITENSSRIRVRSLPVSRARFLGHVLISELMSVSNVVQAYSRDDVITWKGSVIGEVRTFGFYVPQSDYAHVRTWLPELLSLLVPDVCRSRFSWANCPFMRDRLDPPPYVASSMTNTKNPDSIREGINYGVDEWVLKTAAMWEEAVKDLGSLNRKARQRGQSGLMERVADLMPVSQLPSAKICESLSTLFTSIKGKQMLMWG